jgi:type IV pilus assembly protein PilA
MLRKGQKGFTLIELLIVIAIIGILAAIAIPMYRAQTLKAKLTEVTNSMSSIATAVATYYQENNSWPLAAGTAAAIGTTLGVYVPTSRAAFATLNGPIVATEIQATPTNISASNPTIDGTTIILVASTTAGGAISWSWTGSIPIAYMPKK